MEFPEELKYTKDHEWLRIEGDNAYVGVTEFAQDWEMFIYAVYLVKGASLIGLRKSKIF